MNKNSNIIFSVPQMEDQPSGPGALAESVPGVLGLLHRGRSSERKILPAPRGGKRNLLQAQQSREPQALQRGRQPPGRDANRDHVASVPSLTAGAFATLNPRGTLTAGLRPGAGAALIPQQQPLTV